MFKVKNNFVGSGNVFIGESGTGAFTEALESTVGMINKGKGAYITDPKGKVLKSVKTNRDEDVYVIGGDEDHYGVDLLSGLNPYEAANLIIESVGSSASHVDFSIVEYRNKAIHAASVLAYGLCFTPNVSEYEKRYNMRAYTIGFIKELLKNESLRNEVINEVVPDEGCFIEKEYADFALDFFGSKLIHVNKEVWNGILAEAILILDVVSTVPETIKDRFINVNCEKKVDLGSVLEGKIICNAIDATSGSGAHPLSIMLKGKLMMIADKRAIELAKAGKDIREELAGCIILAENYQDLLTSSSTVLSDTTLVNRARSLGVSYNVTIPSIKSLEEAVGDMNAKHFISVLNQVVVKRA